ncbi:hypothetical protein V6L76_01475 [Pannonibacter sp. Pt2]|uniref:Tat pathway signal sequence domain protein n=1 Tax=Pannonibacter anstelovis TaxID=3121537 RepID=A0ABU7ZIL9_9HYPH
MTLARKFEVIAAAALSVSTLSGVALAQIGPAAAEGVKLELNRAADAGNGCLLTFVATNGTGAALETAGFEFVLFNKEGLVDRMTVFDFGALPEGKTVVRQFQIPNQPCTGIGSILVNGASGCKTAAASPLCSAPLTTTSRTDIGFTR